MSNIESTSRPSVSIRQVLQASAVAGPHMSTYVGRITVCKIRLATGLLAQSSQLFNLCTLKNGYIEKTGEPCNAWGH